MTELVMLNEASVSQILDELRTRYEEMPPIPQWAAPVVITIAGYYAMPLEMIVSKRRNDETVKVRHLCIAMLAQLNPSRTQSEVCDVVGVGHEIYRHAIAKIEERVRLFPDFASEVRSIITAIRAHAHCRTSPQGTSAPNA